MDAGALVDAIGACRLAPCGGECEYSMRPDQGTVENSRLDMRIRSYFQ